MSWPTRNSIPMNSLFYTCIQQTPNFSNQKISSTLLDPLSYKSTEISHTKLPLFIRQQILDYFVRIE